MAVVQVPQKAAVVQVPDKDVVVSQAGNATVIEVKTQNMIAHLAAVYLAQVLVVIAFICIALGIFIWAMASALVGIGFIVVGGLVGTLYYVAADRLQKKTVATRVTVSADGVERDDKLYRLEDIDGINSTYDGTEIQTIYAGYRASMKAMTINHINKVSGTVAILFGGDEVEMFANLEEHQVSRAYHAVLDAMVAHGFKTRDAQDG